MANSRFSRRTDSGDNNTSIQSREQAPVSETFPEFMPERTEKKGGLFGSFASKAKEKLGSAADNLKGVFAKGSSEARSSRTAEADAPFEIPDEAPAAPHEAPVPVSQPELVDFSDFDDIAAADPYAAAQKQSVSEPVSEPVTRRTAFADDDSTLPSRWDARQRGGELYFSDRMSDEGFRVKDTTDFEPKKRPAYQGKVVDLARGYDSEDSGEYFYTPNIDVGDENRRQRYKKRNRRPLKFWQKAVITGVCITASFIGLIILTINLMLIGKMNHMDVSGSGDMNDLYFYTPKMVTSILDDSLSMDQEDRTRLTTLNDAFSLPDLALKSDKKVHNYLCISLDEDDNADAIAIISVDEKTKKVRLVNILPDLYVPLADQIGGVSYGTSLRQVYTYGGAVMLRDTVETTFRVSIDYYFVVGFTSFETVVNHLGGADITITDEAISRWMATNKYSPQTRFGGTGRFTLSGEEALLYARMSQPDNSFARAGRQQELFTKLCSKLAEYGTLDLVSALYNALSYVTTDCPASKMLGLCGKLGSYGEYEVKGVTVPIQGTYTEGYVGGEYLLASNITVNANDVQLFLYSNDMTFADGGIEVNVLIPEVSAVLDIPEEPVSSTDMSRTDTE